jgi:hypothetical protein
VQGRRFGESETWRIAIRTGDDLVENEAPVAPENAMAQVRVDTTTRSP